MSELKPCPFCGTSNCEIVSNGHDSQFVECMFCGASGPAHENHDETTEAWNRRAQPAQAVPEGYRLVPDWKGYALLGSGRYLINHAANYDPELGAELIITLATEKDREGGRKIGESRPNAEDAPPVQPDEMVIRIGFLNGDALFALEDQLADVRKVLEAAGKAAPQQAEAVPSDVVRDADVEAAAKKMAEIFDYPWDFMPEKGRNTMRENVRAVLAAAQGEKP